MENTPVKVYLGRFGDEHLLCDISDYDYIPIKGDFLFVNDTAYKVLYVMHDIENGVLDTFVRMAVEEDY